MAEPKVALVGGDSLLGADLRDIFSSRLPRAAVKLAGSEETDTAILTEQGGEAVVMTSVDEQTFRKVEVVVFAGSAESTRRALALLAESGAEPALIDLSFGLEDRPDARLRAPSAEPPAGLPTARVQVVAHPAAIMVATILRALHTIAPVTRAVVTLLAPASERARAGVNELQRQTVQLLSFQKPEQEVFGSQLTFNIHAGTLQETEQRVEKHLATLLNAGDRIPLPSIRVVQAPVMHGYSASIWVELEHPPENVASALRDEGLDIWPDDAPNVIGIAGENGISIGAIEPDRNDRRALWLWAVTDNFRLAAENAVTLTESILT